MALEHLSDEEYNLLKQGGLTALNDDAYARLKLPPGYGNAPHAQDTTLSTAGEAIPELGKQAHSGFESLANNLAGPTGEGGEPNVLGGKGGILGYDPAIYETVKNIPESVGIPTDKLGVLLSGLGGAAELGALRPLGQAAESLGSTIAKKGYQYAGLTPAKAELAMQTAKEALPQAENTMNEIKNTLGIKPFGSGLSANETDALGRNLIDRHGMDIVSSPASSYQDLHNVIDAVSQYGSEPKHWALKGLAQDAILNKAKSEVANAPQLKEVLGNLKDQAEEIQGKLADWSDPKKWNQEWVKPSVDNAKGVLKNIQNAIDNIEPMTNVEAAQSRLDAAQKLAGNRKDIAIGKVGQETSKILPSDLGFGDIARVSGAAGMGLLGHSGISSLLGPLELLRSPLLMKGAIKGSQAIGQGISNLGPMSGLMYNDLNAK